MHLKKMTKMYQNFRCKKFLSKEKPLELQKEHLAFQNIKYFHFSFNGLLAFLDPGSDPQHCL